MNYPTGSPSSSLVAGDFNGDQKLDIATANSNGTVSILLGNGDGTFQAKTDYPTGASSRSIAIGDFNKDGKRDIVTSNYSEHTVSILIGNGDGTFQTKVAYSTDYQPYSVIVADLNRDGNSDVATANEVGSVSILIGNSDGSFQPKIDYQTGDASYSITAGDFNEDGNPDLVTANYWSTVSVFLGNGDGTFQNFKSYTTDYHSLSITTGDFNGDGKTDLATASYWNFNISIILNIHGKDNTPPVVTLYTNPTVLWPPNHKMVNVFIGGEAYDTETGVASVEFTVSDEYGKVQQVVSGFNSTIQLEAWREGSDKDGRHYTITATATDFAGNKSTTSTVVWISHDQR